jgi:catechol 2,3-dioxygenase-like lactoylglutathione lyase family enzyme
MTDPSSLFDAFDRGGLSRRQLLKALGLTAAVAVSPVSALAQGQCGGKEGTPGCDTTPAKLPFEPTGWKTVLLDHFTCRVEDHAKEAAYYNALMNWKVRSFDAKQAVLDIGDWGGLILKGGYKAPPPTAAELKRYARFQERAKKAGRTLPPYKPAGAIFDNFCWGIDPWDAKTVEAELRKRGLSPVADNHGDFESFHVKDPEGFDLQISNGSRRNRRTTAAAAKSSAPAPFPHTDWKTIWLDHISYQVSDYKKTVAFYTALLGWKPGEDEGSQNQCEIGDVGDIIIRRGFAYAPGQPPPAPHAEIGHIAFGITPFDPDKVKAELEKRGLPAHEDTGGKGDIHTAFYKSYHTTTPNRFDLQISATNKATRSGNPT